MLAKAAMMANSFLLAISTNASTMAIAADVLRLVCHLSHVCQLCHMQLAGMGQNGQNVAVGAQNYWARRDDEIATERCEIKLPKSWMGFAQKVTAPHKGLRQQFPIACRSRGLTRFFVQSRAGWVHLYTTILGGQFLRPRRKKIGDDIVVPDFRFGDRRH